MSLNVFTATGNIGGDADTRYTPNQKVVTSFSLAVTTGWGDKQKTMWVRCNGWGDRFAKLAEYLVKGAKVGIVGELSLSEWTDKSGEKRTSLECNLRDVDLPPKSDAQPMRDAGGFRDSAAANMPERMAPSEIPHGGLADEDCPF